MPVNSLYNNKAHVEILFFYKPTDYIIITPQLFLSPQTYRLYNYKPLDSQPIGWNKTKTTHSRKQTKRNTPQYSRKSLASASKLYHL